jgi:Protein of unknown function (DUF559)
VVARAQLLSVGASTAAVDAWVQRGRLHRLPHGVYALGHASLRPEGHRLAAVLACGPNARGRHGAPGIRLHRSRSLDAQDTTNHHGIPVTTVSRTLLDLAATARPGELERALAQAERLQLYDHRAIESVSARCNGHRGTHVLAQATTREAKWTRNEWEAAFLHLLRQGGMPEPLVNDAFHAPDHGHCEPDYHWPTHQVIVETDGWETHRTRQAFKNDRAKDAALTASGYRVLRFTKDVEPELVVRRLRALLPSAGSRPRSGSPDR